jgi:hypothetical protein
MRTTTIIRLTAGAALIGLAAAAGASATDHTDTVALEDSTPRPTTTAPDPDDAPTRREDAPDRRDADEAKAATSEDTEPEAPQVTETEAHTAAHAQQAPAPAPTPALEPAPQVEPEPVDWTAVAECIWPMPPGPNPYPSLEGWSVENGGLVLWHHLGGTGYPHEASTTERAARAEVAVDAGMTPCRP